MAELKFLVGVNTGFTDKVRPGDGRFWSFNMGFRNLTLTMPQLVAHIRQGHAWTAPHRHIRRPRPTARRPDYRTSYRVRENVISSQLLALDCDTEDERSTFYFLLQDEFIAENAVLLHETASATPERPRTRVVFLLDQPLEPDAYRTALRGLLYRYPFCDQSVNHAAVAFFGAWDCRYYLRDKLLPVPILKEEIVQPYTQALVADQARREKKRLAAAASAIHASTQIGEKRITNYVHTTFHNILNDLADTLPGLGLRHQRLLVSALKLGSLQVAHWLTPEGQALLRPVVGRLLDAAVQNGYVADYGEDEALRTIDNGLAIGAERPWSEPLWNAAFFPEVGERTAVWREDRLLARGTVRTYRETAHGWEFQLAERPRVWFSQQLLKPESDSPAGEGENKV